MRRAITTESLRKRGITPRGGVALAVGARRGEGELARAAGGRRVSTACVVPAAPNLPPTRHLYPGQADGWASGEEKGHTYLVLRLHRLSMKKSKPGSREKLKYQRRKCQPPKARNSLSLSFSFTLSLSLSLSFSHWVDGCSKSVAD